MEHKSSSNKNPNFVPPRPKNLVDIAHYDHTPDSFNVLSSRVVFGKRRDTFLSKGVRAFFQPVLKIAVILVVLLGLFAGGVNAPISIGTFAASESESDITNQRQELEAELRRVEAEIVNYESTIHGLRRQQNTLKNELKRLEARIAQINLRIKATNLSLEKLNTDIEETQNKISETEEEIKFQKKTLAQALRVIYQEESASMVEILMRNPRLSDFFGEINSLLVMQNTTRETLLNVTDLKAQLLEQKETLALERSDVIALKELNESQKEELNDTIAEKDYLLRTTQGEENKYQALLKEREQTAADIRNRIFSLLGGGELTFERAVELAKFAEGATGVRAALILAVLDQESSFGRNVGQCTLADTTSGASVGINTGRRFRSGIHPTRDLPLFLSITESLGLDPMNTLISCPIPSVGGYGGAMGPTQFIPSTWMIYADKVADAMGIEAASPWNNSHAFMATGFYLSDNYHSRECTNYAVSNRHILPQQYLQERCAAAKYYAGSNWRLHRFGYGDMIATKANEYQEDIDILDRQ